MAHFARSWEGHFIQGPGLRPGVTCKGVQRTLPGMPLRAGASLKPLASGLVQQVDGGGPEPLKSNEIFGPTSNMRYAARDTLFNHGLQVHALKQQLHPGQMGRHRPGGAPAGA